MSLSRQNASGNLVANTIVPPSFAQQATQNEMEAGIVTDARSMTPELVAKSAVKFGGRKDSAAISLTSFAPNTTLTSTTAHHLLVSAEVSGCTLTMPNMTTMNKGGNQFIITNTTKDIGVLDAAGNLRDVVKRGPASINVHDNSTSSGEFYIGAPETNIAGIEVEAKAFTYTTLNASLGSWGGVHQTGSDEFIVIYGVTNGGNYDWKARLLTINPTTLAVTLGAEQALFSLSTTYGFSSYNHGVGGRGLLTLSGPASTTCYGYSILNTSGTYSASSSLSLVSGGYFGQSASVVTHVGNNNYVMQTAYGDSQGNTYGYFQLLYWTGSALAYHGTTLGGTTNGAPLRLLQLTDVIFAQSHSTSAYNIVTCVPASNSWSSVSRTGTYASSLMPGETSGSASVYYYPTANKIVAKSNGVVYGLTGSGSTMATTNTSYKRKKYYSASYSTYASSYVPGGEPRYVSYAGSARFINTYHSTNENGKFTVSEFSETVADMNFNDTLYASSPLVSVADFSLSKVCFLSTPYVVFAGKLSSAQLAIYFYQMAVPFKK
jgi:hypothetical protein